MFELMLNAVKVAFSKDARESATALIDVLRRSPDWEKAIGTIEARVSNEFRERVKLLEDVVADKLKALQYEASSIGAFRTAVQELTANAFEHGVTSRTHRTIRLVIETSQSYVSVCVHNPKKSPFRLADALAAAARHRVESQNLGRGRGLIAVCRRTDVVEMIDDRAIKALIYRDVVDIERHDSQGIIIAVVTSGHSNPSLPRRVRDYLDDHFGQRIVLCLDQREFDKYRAQDGDVLADDHDDDKDIGSVCLSHMLQDVQRRNAAGSATIRVVGGSRGIADLLPESVVSRTIAIAMRELK